MPGFGFVELLIPKYLFLLPLDFTENNIHIFAICDDKFIDNLFSAESLSTQENCHPNTIIIPFEIQNNVLIMSEMIKIMYNLITPLYIYIQKHKPRRQDMPALKIGQTNPNNR